MKHWMFFVCFFLLFTVPNKAMASWACEVVLCVANPAGPMAVKECVPPITKLYRHLRLGGVFPLCRSDDGHVRFTRYGYQRYAECSSGSKLAYHRETDKKGKERIFVFCEKFVPLYTGAIAHNPYERYEMRIINGKKVRGVIKVSSRPERGKPHYLEYRVNGKKHYLWWKK